MIFMYIVIDELEAIIASFGEYNSNLKTVLHKRKAELMQTINKVITMPIIASAADNYLANFSDSCAVLVIISDYEEDLKQYL